METTTQSKFNSLYTKFCSDFKRSYELCISNSSSVKKTQSIIDNLTQLESLLSKTIDRAAFEQFLICSSTDLWSSKNEIIEELNSTGLMFDCEKDQLLRQISTLKKQASEKLGTFYLEELKTKMNIPEVWKYIPDEKKRLTKWLVQKGTDEDLVNILFIHVYSDPFLELLKKIREVKAYNRLLVMLVELFVTPPINANKNLEGVLTITSRSQLVSMSALFDKINEYKFDTIHTIIMLVPGTIVMDTDISNNEHSGKNFVIVAENIDMSCGDKTIDVSGKPGQSAPDNRANDGKSYKAEIDKIDEKVSIKLKRGNPGHDGENGKNATTSGDVVISCSKLLGQGKLTIKVNGGNGGNGQDGGNGANGEQGDHGTDAGIYSGGRVLFTYRDDTYYLLEGYQGDRGGYGGNGGNGGNPGVGSREGTAHLVGGGTEAKVFSESGDYGIPGKKGNGGEIGSGGNGGDFGIKKVTIHQSVILHEPVINKTEKKYLKDDPEFNKIWNEVTTNAHLVKDEDLKKLLSDKRGPVGDQGRKGIDGKDGEKDDKKDLLSNPNKLSFYQSIANCVVLLFQDGVNKNFILYNSGIFDTNTLQSGFLYTLFKKLEDKEKNLSDSQKEIQYMQLAKAIYEKSQESILNRKEIAEAEWQVLLFIINQKLGYFNERLAGGGTNGNQIVNLKLLNEHLKFILNESEEISIDEKKEKYYQEFSSRINSAIASGNSQVKILKKRIDDLMDKSSRDISHLLDEISMMKRNEERYKEELKRKKEALRAEMEMQLFFGVLSSVISVAETVVGVGSVFSGLTQSISQTVGEKDLTNVSMNELRNKIKNDRDIIQAGKDFTTQKFTPMIDMPDGIPFEIHKQVLDKLDVSEITKKKEYTEKNMNSYLLKLKELEIEKLSKRWEPFRPDDPSPDPRIRKKQEEEFQLEKSKDLERIDKEIRDAIKEKDELPQALYDLRKAEIDGLKRNQDLVTDKEKLSKLEQYSKVLQKEEDSYRLQRITKTIGQVIEVGSKVYEGVTKYINTQKEYQSKIDEVNDAIKSSKDKIGALVTMDNNVRAYQEDTLNKNLLKYLDEEQKDLKTQDTFKLTISQLDIKGKLTNMINDVKIKFESMESSAELTATLQSIEEALSTQIIIFDKIQGVETQRQMGELIHGLNNNDVYTLTQEQLDYCKSSKIVRLQYLTQLELNAYLLWAFPFGFTGINYNQKTGICCSDTYEDAMKKAKAQNDAIADWVRKEQYSLSKKDSRILYRNFINDSAYATINFNDNIDEAKRLLTGEEITLELPPSKAYDIVKYVTFYAYIPLYKEVKAGKYKPDEIEVHIQFKGITSFSVYDDKHKKASIYQFNQDPIWITHSLDVKIEEKEDAKAISASEEDKAIRKFKRNNMDSGRSPYSQISIRLKKKFWTKTFSLADLSDKLKDEFKTVFPYDSNIDSRIKLIIKDLQGMEWITNDQLIIASWYEISSSEELNDKGYTLDQIQWIKNVLFEQSNIFGLPELTMFAIQFIGYGLFLDQDEYKIPKEYERFKVEG